MNYIRSTTVPNFPKGFARHVGKSDEEYPLFAVLHTYYGSTQIAKVRRYTFTQPRTAYFSRVDKIDVFTPDFTAVFIMTDIHQCEVVRLADHFACRRIGIHTSLKI
jgi:hypothetical protein